MPAVYVAEAHDQFLKLSPQHRAHELARRYHSLADLINVGTTALTAECGPELKAVLRTRPGRQTLLPKFKHIDVAIEELLTIQHMGARPPPRLRPHSRRSHSRAPLAATARPPSTRRDRTVA